jgi:hypothetical protein
MNSRILCWGLCAAALSPLTPGAGALAQDEEGRALYLSGVINDYTPVGSGLSSPWELRGLWTLQLHEDGTASFSAALTMELSDFGQTLASVNAVTRTQHTHHITLRGSTVTVTYNPTDCPAAPKGSPPYTARIALDGPASVLANGSVAPFGEFSQLRVCVAGGAVAPYSNITLEFQPPAAGHFGPQAIHGVVRHVSHHDG